jgi:hypothetical protein
MNDVNGEGSTLNPMVETLTRAIQADLAAVEACERERYERYRSIGHRLNLLKLMIPFGQWLPWLEGNFNWKSERTAQRYMAYANTTPASDLKGERAVWERVNGHKPPDAGARVETGAVDAAGERQLRDPPPDDGSRQITIITDEEAAELFDAVLERWRRRCPGITNGQVFKHIL